MKANLILFFILITLITGTYFFQEKVERKNFEASLIAGRIITESITSIETSSFKAHKIKGQWREGDDLLSHNELSRLVKMLSTIKELKKIDHTEVTGTSFKINDKNYVLGEMNLDKSGFYFKVEDSAYIALIDSDSQQIHSHNDNVNEMKLAELQNLLHQSQQELLENQLFRYYPDLTYEAVVIKPEGALDYELDFKLNSTLPIPIKGIEEHQDLAAKFKSLIAQINIKKRIDADPKLKKKKLGEITFLPSEMKWEVFLSQKNKADVFLFDSEGNTFEMVGGTLKVFLIQLQDYWDKKVIPPSDFQHFDKLHVNFSQGTEELSLTVHNREPLTFSSEEKINEEKIGLLFQVIFNLSNFDQGQRVSNLTTSQLRQIISEDNLRLEIMGQELAIVSYGQEIIVANITQEYKVHFLKMESFPLTIKDMLK